MGMWSDREPRLRKIVSGKWQTTGLSCLIRSSIATGLETAMTRSSFETMVFWFLLTISLMVPWLMLD
jgi:hypothetical protein